MTKEEKIQEAYGEYWDEIGSIVSKDGWFYCSEADFRLDNIMPLEYNGANHKMRPKSLKGIEYNNGWIKIESEEDLPIYGYYEVIERNSQRTIRAYLDRAVVIDYQVETYSHYQPIIKIELPIY